MKNLCLLKVVNVLALSSLGLVVNVGAHSAVAHLGQLSVNVEGKGAELAYIDRVALAEVLVEVGYETAPNDQHLKSCVKQQIMKLT
jgi:hypothetical protein